MSGLASPSNEWCLVSELPRPQAPRRLRWSPRRRGSPRRACSLQPRPPGPRARRAQPCPCYHARHEAGTPQSADGMYIFLTMVFKGYSNVQTCLVHMFIFVVVSFRLFSRSFKTASNYCALNSRISLRTWSCTLLVLSKRKIFPFFRILQLFSF